MALLNDIKRKVRFRGAVFSPGEDTIAAVNKIVALLPVEFTIYGDASNIETIKSRFTGDCCKFVRTEDPVRELSTCLFGEALRTGSSFHFLVRGDFLSLEDTRLAVSIPGSDTRGRQANQSASGTSVSSELTKPRSPFLSHVAAIEAPSLSRVLVITDGFVNQRPDVETRLAIIRNGVRVCEVMGTSYPKVALLAAVEQVYPGMPVTVESSEIAKMAAAGEIEGAAVDGPLSFDVALVEHVAREKGATGRVAGNADLLVGSSIEVINGIYMAQTVLARANAASVVVGGKTPLALPFPSDCVDNIFLSMCLACLQSTNEHSSVG